MTNSYQTNPDVHPISPQPMTDGRYRVFDYRDGSVIREGVEPHAAFEFARKANARLRRSK